MTRKYNNRGNVTKEKRSERQINVARWEGSDKTSKARTPHTYIVHLIRIILVREVSNISATNIFLMSIVFVNFSVLKMALAASP